MEEDKFPMWYIYVGVGAGAFILLVVIICLCCAYRKKKQQQSKSTKKHEMERGKFELKVARECREGSVDRILMVLEVKLNLLVI